MTDHLDVAATPTAGAGELVSALQLARAIGVSGGTRKFTLCDPKTSLPYEGQRFDHVLAALSRSDITPDLSARVHTVAYALRKCIVSARMDSTSALRIMGYKPYDLCRLVARIANECPETTIGGICDVWLLANHASL